MTEDDESIPVSSVMNKNVSVQNDPQGQINDTHITVAVRCRPLFENEKQLVGRFTRTNILRIQDNLLFLQDPFEGIDSKIERTREERMYEFDYCFDGDSSNQEVWFLVFLYKCVL